MEQTDLAVITNAAQHEYALASWYIAEAQSMRRLGYDLMADALMVKYDQRMASLVEMAETRDHLQYCSWEDIFLETKLR